MQFEVEVVLRVLREWAVAVAKLAEAVHFVIQPRCQTWSCKCLALALVTEDSSVTTRWLCRDEEDDVGRFVCVDKYNRMHYANHTEKRQFHSMLADGTLQLLVPNATVTMVRAVPSLCPEVPWQVIAVKALHDRIHEAVAERVLSWSGACQPVCHICGEPGERQVGEDERDILAEHDGYHEPEVADRSKQPLVFCPLCGMDRHP